MIELFHGVLAQLVERFNGIEEVMSSSLIYSTMNLKLRKIPFVVCLQEVFLFDIIYTI